LPSDIVSSDQIDDIIMLFGDKNIDIIDTDKGDKLSSRRPLKKPTTRKKRRSHPDADRREDR
jgi:RNA polymerase primary sigma factor